MRPPRANLLLLCGLLALIGSSSISTADDRELFFEAKIRPVLIAHCYECHNSVDAAEGKLQLDHRRGWQQGGEGGPVIVPGKAAESRLLRILRHEVDGLEMPQGGPRLNKAVLADFERWINEGAVDPRDQPPTHAELAVATSWKELSRQRRQWWSFQPIQDHVPPTVRDDEWNRHPIDRFVYQRLEENQLEPAPRAASQVLIRRLFFALTGLPPTPEQIDSWSHRLDGAEPPQQTTVYQELVDALLESPHYGERWARHWMDWIRYAESHGSEGDPDIPNAWVYRDYLIRALNADTPYDQLVREHIAGDLLKHPRLNRELEINESVIGTAHWRMVFHGFSPTDALDEKVRFIDDQINVFSKAFLGLTVSCARCHDHKFDAISQQDYYALFGILASCRPGSHVFDVADRQQRHAKSLLALKYKIRTAIAHDWIEHLSNFESQSMVEDTFWKAAENPQQAFHPWHATRHAVAQGQSWASAWRQQCETLAEHERQRQQFLRQQFPHQWNLARDTDVTTWFREGPSLQGAPADAGSFAINMAGDQALAGIYPAGLYTHQLSSKHAGQLTSPDFPLDDDYDLWLLVRGDKQASLRYVVQDYPRSGTVFPLTRLTDAWIWQRYDVSYWKGDTIHLELATAQDAPLLVAGEPRSWFGMRKAVVSRRGQPRPPNAPEAWIPVFSSAEAESLTSDGDLARHYAAVIRDAVRAWDQQSLSDGQALLLDDCLQSGVLPNLLDRLPSARSLISTYRQLEEDIPVPRRVPGLAESTGTDQPLYVRGNHKQPSELVPRRFLESLDDSPYVTQASGRRELAEDVLRSDNPWTRRVIVNRLWHHLFGRGLVATPDNLGRMGEPPSHPELLDFLAEKFSQDGWSLKQMIRFIVTSRTWQLDSRPGSASTRDPENTLLSHARLRRLEAESVRDALLSVSGKLDPQLYGTPVASNSTRRGIYVSVRRNSLDPFLRIFDFPEPFSAAGRRSSTNVPAQSLAFLNDPFVAEQASAWATRTLQYQAASPSERVERMFLIAFGRSAQSQEIEQSLAYLANTEADWEARRTCAILLSHQIARATAQIEELLGPVRQRLVEQTDVLTSGAAQLPPPVAFWDFRTSAHDQVDSLQSTLHGDARVDQGLLRVRNGGYLQAEPLTQPLREKTLAAWVQLNNLAQQGGGVLSVQSLDGRYFDAIVFGERQAARWLAGSNTFSRTQDFGGPPETVADKQPVHVAITYASNGTITGYRNGHRYGSAYRSDGPFPFAAEQTVVTLGLRHLPATGNRSLQGDILQAQVYDQTLSAVEIATLARSPTGYISDQELLAALTPSGRDQVRQLRADLVRWKQELRELGEVVDASSDQVLWTELAKALLLTQELIYLR
ncbi:MAG: DUF1553 domain-containing protein [Planctomycetales bacterium]|nr:DUF1553 domain-containing protein [Planctomycetales bacterium]